MSDFQKSFSDIGMINETDVSLAKASNALLIGFNVKPNREAKKLAEEQKIEIKYFNIIYEALDYVEKSLSGLLEPDIKENSKNIQSFKCRKNCWIKSIKRGDQK